MRSPDSKSLFRSTNKLGKEVSGTLRNGGVAKRGCGIVGGAGAAFGSKGAIVEKVNKRPGQWGFFVNRRVQVCLKG